MDEFRYTDAMMVRILAACRTGEEWWVWHPRLAIQVSNLRVRGVGGRVLKPDTSTGYARVRVDGERYRVHGLVLESFVGDRPDGEECRHWDDDPQNNRLNNLFWGTRLENMADRRRNNRQRENDERRRKQAVISGADRPDRQRIARQLAVLNKLEQLAST